MGHRPPPQTLAGQPLRVWTLPNAIGFLRLALIPLFLVLALSSSDGTDALPAGSEVKVTYRAPTRPGDELTVRLGELGTAEDGRTELAAECVTQAGTAVVSITALLPAPAAG